MHEQSVDSQPVPTSETSLGPAAPRKIGSWLPKGRQMGVANKRSIEQRAFARRVFYGVDGKERKKFEEKIRTMFYAGELPPAIFQRMLDYLYGKPTEHVEVKDMTDETLRAMSLEELRARALEVAGALPDIDTVAVPSPVEPVEVYETVPSSGDEM